MKSCSKVPYDSGAATTRRTGDAGRTVGRLAKSVAASLFLVLLLVCLSGFLVSIFLTLPTSAARGSGAGIQGHSRGIYFREQQYLADARTAAHMLWYLLEPEPHVAQTNTVVQG